MNDAALVLRFVARERVVQEVILPAAREANFTAAANQARVKGAK
jgi:hypothetical protein